MLAAIKYPQRIKGLIGLAAAPNFVKYFADRVSDEQKHDLERFGKFKIVNNDFEYTITARFIETAMASLLPDDSAWTINCPVHLLQGMKDASVPWRSVLDYAFHITSANVVIKLLKDSNHRLNDEFAINELKASLVNIVNICK